MAEWTRTTTDLGAAVPAPWSAALEAHATRVGATLGAPVAVARTEGRKAGWFGRVTTVTQVGVLAPPWLAVLGREGEGPVAVVLARLRDATGVDYATTADARLVPDTGLRVDGRFAGATEAGSLFLGLDDGPAGRAFRDAALAALRDAG